MPSLTRNKKPKSMRTKSPNQRVYPFCVTLPPRCQLPSPIFWIFTFCKATKILLTWINQNTHTHTKVRKVTQIFHVFLSFVFLRNFLLSFPRLQNKVLRFFQSNHKILCKMSLAVFFFDLSRDVRMGRKNFRMKKITQLISMNWWKKEITENLSQLWFVIKASLVALQKTIALN